MLFIHGKDDDVVDLWEPKELKTILNKSGNKNVKLKYIPNAKHDCMENPKYTVNTISKWISNF